VRGALGVCSKLAQTTAEGFTLNLYERFLKHERFSKSKGSVTDFTLAHYAGKVGPARPLAPLEIRIHVHAFTGSFWSSPRSNNCCALPIVPGPCVACRVFCCAQVKYLTDEFIAKNMDAVVPEHEELLKKSSNAFIAAMFPEAAEATAAKGPKFNSIGKSFKVCLAPECRWSTKEPPEKQHSPQGNYWCNTSLCVSEVP